jgi:hypothetical protein
VSDAPGFTEWAAEVLVSAAGTGHGDPVALAVRIAPRDWLAEAFAVWGPLPWEDLRDLALIDEQRLGPLVVGHLRAMVPTVLADARACGVEAAAVLDVGDGLAVRLVVDWGQGRYGPSGWVAPAGDDAELRAWLADGIQEVTMERGQRDCHVWPVCPRHRLGGHARVDGGTAIWWCNGGAGHQLAPIGRLAR